MRTGKLSNNLFYNLNGKYKFTMSKMIKKYLNAHFIKWGNTSLKITSSKITSSKAIKVYQKISG
jgi:hypothetical protein